MIQYQLHLCFYGFVNDVSQLLQVILDLKFITRINVDQDHWSVISLVDENSYSLILYIWLVVIIFSLKDFIQVHNRH